MSTGDAPVDLVGTTVGSIRLEERLGEGGMGEVYIGVDDRLGRRVAVKAIRPDRRLKPRARDQFLREARILSQLEHPNICRLYELVEEDDSDFLVLELIRGKNLREFQEDGLSRSQCFDIAEQILTALAAAHSMSVVHRDLKPDNIMITPDQTVKVLDFGLARTVAADSPKSTEASGAHDLSVPVSSPGTNSTLTVIGDVKGTPQYMSPEQARGEPVTAASDMYSFGLILSELFTGRLPYGDDLTMDTLRHRARWGDIAPARGLDPQLAELIGRLTAFRSAERPAATEAVERLRWIRERPRRRLRRLIAAAVAASLAVAAVVSIIGFVQARRAQKRAEASERSALAAKAESEAVNSFLRDMLASADPDRYGIDVKVVDVLDSAAESVDDDFGEHPLIRAAVLHTLGETYHAIGEFTKAEGHLVDALEIRRDRLGEEHAQTLSTRARIGAVLSDLGDFAEAEPILREVLDARRRSLGDDPETANSMASLAQLLQRDRRFEEALELARETLELRRQVLGEDHPDTFDADRLVARLNFDLGRHDEAERMLRATLDRQLEALGENHPEILSTTTTLVVVIFRARKFEECEVLARRVVDGWSAVLGEDHPKTLKAVSNLAITLVQLGRYEEAERLLRPSLELQRAALGAAHPDCFSTMRNLGNAVSFQGRKKEAEQIYRERVEIAEGELGPEHRITLENKSVLAHFLAKDERYGESERLYREVLESRSRIFGEDHRATLRTRAYLARMLRAAGRDAEADAVAPPGG